MAWRGEGCGCEGDIASAVLASDAQGETSCGGRRLRVRRVMLRAHRSVTDAARWRTASDSRPPVYFGFAGAGFSAGAGGAFWSAGAGVFSCAFFCDDAPFDDAFFEEWWRAW